MNISCYIDPCCPYCWITSRWLTEVSQQRNINISWELFSLAIKNNEITLTDGENDKAENHRASHRVLRIMQAARDNHQADTGKLYTSFGEQYFIHKQPYDENTMSKVLQDHKLPASLLTAADDTTVDDKLSQSTQSATEAIGEDIGVPTIVFQDKDKRSGFFGPVLTEMPDTDNGIKLWDGLEKLVSIPGFCELKRSKPEGGADVASTGRLFNE